MRIQHQPDDLPPIIDFVQTEDDLHELMLADAKASPALRRRDFKTVTKNKPHLGRIGATLQSMIERLSDEPQTGAELAEGLGLSRDAVRKAVKRLGDLGIAKNTGEKRCCAYLWVRA